MCQENPHLKRGHIRVHAHRNGYHCSPSLRNQRYLCDAAAWLSDAVSCSCQRCLWPVPQEGRTQPIGTPEIYTWASIAVWGSAERTDSQTPAVEMSTQQSNVNWHYQLNENLHAGPKKLNHWRLLQLAPLASSLDPVYENRRQLELQ